MVLSKEVFGKALFVVSCLASAPFQRFGQLLLLDRGVTAAELGVLQLTWPFKAIGYVAWGLLADRIGLKWALLASLLLSTLALEPFRVTSTYQSFAMLWVARAARTFLNGAYPLIDSFAVIAAGVRGYGAIRLFGSLSFGLSGLLVGGVLDYFYQLYGYATIFALQYSLTALLMLMVWLYFPRNDPNLLANENGTRLSEVWAAVARRKTAVFLFSCILYGMSTSVSSTVVPVWVRQEFRKGAFFLGVLSVTSVSLCVVVFYYADRLLERYGAKRLLLWAHGFHLLRVALYATVSGTNVGMALPLIELLHGGSFALFWVGATSVMQGDQVLASNQSLLAVCHTTIGQVGLTWWFGLWLLKRIRS